MPLSDPTSLYLTDLARRRAMAQALAQSSTSAAQSGIGVLQHHDTEQKAAAQQAQENAIRLRQVQDTEDQNAATNTRETARDRESIRLHNIENATRVNNEQTSAYERANEREIRLRQVSDAEAERTYQHGREGAQDKATTEDRARTQRKAAVGAAVAAASGGSGDVDADALDSIVTQTGATRDEVKAAALELQQATAGRNNTMRHQKVEESQGWARIAAEKDAAKARADAAKAKAGAADAKGVEDVTDFKSAVQNARNLTPKIDGGHMARVIAGQKIGERAQEHGGIMSAAAGVATSAYANSQTTDEEAQLLTTLATIKAKSVKGLEGAHRAVSQHQIELVDSALNALTAGDMAKFNLQLGELERAADDTAAAIAGSRNNPGMGNPAAVPTALPTSSAAPASFAPRPNPF